MTNKQLEQKLNEDFSSLSYDEAMERFAYLGNKSRGEYAQPATIQRAYSASKLGTLLKKYDPIAFYCSRSDY